MIRNQNIDILKGIGILCVLLGHITSSGRLHNLIYTFHMPLFFMASGYFYRPQSTAILASKLLHTIGTPYLIFSLLNFFIQWLVSEERNINIGQETIMFFLLMAGIITHSSFPIYPLSAYFGFFQLLLFVELYIISYIKLKQQEGEQ